MKNPEKSIDTHIDETDMARPYKEKKDTWWLIITGAVLFFLLSMLVATMFGSAGPVGPSNTRIIGFIDVITEILSRILQILNLVEKQEDTVQKIIVWDIRMPRILMGALVGVALAVSGVLMQALFKNPMADPFILGLASGASTGATLAIISGSLLGFLLGYAIPLFAFTGATVTIVTVYYISKVRGSVKTETLLLSGIA
ncbi:MAG: FecCD family ABC transporter permease, partial [Candidatus Hodarchaeales archaeon]